MARVSCAGLVLEVALVSCVAVIPRAVDLSGSAVAAAWVFRSGFSEIAARGQISNVASNILAGFAG